MAVRPIDAMELKQRMCALCNQDYSDEAMEKPVDENQVLLEGF